MSGSFLRLLGQFTYRPNNFLGHVAYKRITYDKNVTYRRTKYSPGGLYEPNIVPHLPSPLSRQVYQ